MVLSIEGQLELLMHKLHMDCNDDHDRIAVYKDILALAESVLDDYHVPVCDEIWDGPKCEFYREQFRKVLPMLKDGKYMQDRRMVITRPLKSE